MTNVKMKAIDQLHVSSVSEHNLHAGTVFEVSGHIADDLEGRGLAERIGEVEAKQPETKAIIAAPENKPKKVGK